MSSRPGERKARIAMWLGRRASRDLGFVDRLCRRLLDRMLRLPEDDDFLRDEWVDSDLGYDPEELERYQRGETAGRAKRAR